MEEIQSRKHPALQPTSSQYNRACFFFLQKLQPPSQTLEENPANQFVYKIRSSNKSFGECPEGIQGKTDNKFQAKEYTRETSVQCKYNIHCSLQ